MFCKQCGNSLSDQAVICPKCGCSTDNQSVAQPKENQWLVAFILSVCVGQFGAHRFFLGQTELAIVQLCTLGGCGVWSFVDQICLAANIYSVNGKKPKGYMKEVGIAWAVVVAILTIVGLIFSIIGVIAD